MFELAKEVDYQQKIGGISGRWHNLCHKTLLADVRIREDGEDGFTVFWNQQRGWVKSASGDEIGNGQREMKSAKEVKNI